MWIATAEQSREMDRLATEVHGISIEDLMERAGAALAEAVLERHPEGAVLVACGKGNNGGDGLVAARKLRLAGREVSVLVAVPEAELDGLAKLQLDRAKGAGIRPVFAGASNWCAETFDSAEVVIDAVFGTGLTRAPEGAAAELIQWINGSDSFVVSADVPSGIAADSGAALGDAVTADLTIGFGLPKPGLFQGDGLEACGEWIVEPIGFPEVLLEAPRDAFVVDRDWVAERMPHRSLSSHKGASGKLLIVAGSADMPGAAALVATGALRAGVGLVTVACTAEVRRSIAPIVPEATFLTLPELDGTLAEAADKALLGVESRFDAAVFGPGLSRGLDVVEALSRIWSWWTRPCVLDADALNALASGASLPHAPSVLTPHAGELARLLLSTPEEVQLDRFGSARRGVDEFRRTVVLKGAYSLIASPHGPLAVNPTGNPGMATGGMGDVLSGVIGALLAQGLSPDEAAAAGVYWHGLAGDLCAEMIGSVGFTAMDLARALPAARDTFL